jgi:integrase
MDTLVQNGPDSRIARPWNKGKIGPPLSPKHVWAVRTRLQLLKRFRDLAMFNLAIDSKLRGCDLVGLTIVDAAPHGYAVDRASVRQRKKGRPVRFEIMEQTRQAIDDYLSQQTDSSSPYLFPGRGPAGHLTTRQYARLLGRWLAMIGLDPRLYSTHSLRRTKATLIYRKTGNLRAVQLLLGHAKIESTVPYLGIEVDDALAVAEQIDV